jgi:Fe2+ or Zn2+ uptake regulation protein
MSSIKDKLAAKGFRLTQPRQVIFEVLSHRPQSVMEIIEKLAKKKLQIDKVTVYRTLSNFVKLNLVEETQFKDKISVYELADHEHHHHVLCEKCGQIEDIHLDEKLLINAAKKLSSFQINSHHLEFFGLCKKCH